MEEPIQPYSDSLHSYTWKEDDDTIHLRRKKEKRAMYTSHECHCLLFVISAEAFVSERWISCKLFCVIELFAW